jgi:hypothetical protein
VRDQFGNRGAAKTGRIHVKQRRSRAVGEHNVELLVQQDDSLRQALYNSPTRGSGNKGTKT